MSDLIFDVATAQTVNTKVWKNKKYTWYEFVDKIKNVHRTPETFKEFQSATKAEQDAIKDVGGYVGGYLRNGRRTPATNVLHRQLITLDLDYANIDFWDDFRLQFDSSAILHQTHSHSEQKPRFRLLIPTDREVSTEEYAAISRKIAGMLGMELFDPTTFQIQRLMFWPSISSDKEYFFKTQNSKFLSADEILESYGDWKDASEWPLHPKEADIRPTAEKQEDPLDKKGVIGAFCRTYSITETIEKFLSDKYVKSDIEDRYTYLLGSTSSGLVVYENKFAFSHHGTDPTSSKLMNAFDFVRVHKFGHLDEGNKPGQKSKSFESMENFAKKDPRVRKTIAEETIDVARYEFSQGLEPVEGDDAEEVNLEWAENLEIDSKGNYLSSSTNINLIFSNDPKLSGVFKMNVFDNQRYIFSSVPWRKVDKPEPMRNVDYSGIRNYLECVYGIIGNLKIDDVVNLELEKNSFNPVFDYLEGLTWDGVKRVDNLFIDYLGAHDNLYSKEAARKMLVAAVGRIYCPGIKFDTVVTFVGVEGTGKSTLVKKLGREWFSDTFMGVQGKEALEQIQGAWIIEMAELSGIRKADVEAVKHFISKQEDSFRPAYGRTKETYKRQCIFVGTTNHHDFLKGTSGNRRFLPIDVRPHSATKSPFNNELDDVVNDLWAEAVHLYKNGEKLYLSKEAEKFAGWEQQKHSELDDRSGLVEAYLDKLLPTNWPDLDVFERRLWLEDPLSVNGSVERDLVCIAEIWCECLAKNKEDMTRYNTREINEIMRALDEWEPHNSTKNFPIYGKQKYYARKLF